MRRVERQVSELVRADDEIARIAELSIKIVEVNCGARTNIRDVDAASLLQTKLRRDFQFTIPRVARVS